MTKEQYEQARKKTLDYFRIAGIVLSEAEKINTEVADFGLNELESTGLEIITYVNTDGVCAKELVLLPGQTCPEHRHPPVEDEPGKVETFRWRWGETFLYVPGEKTVKPKGKPPKGREKWYTAWNEIVLKAGDQYMAKPNMLNWFQAGKEGAIVSEFSTKSRDECDVFTNPAIAMLPVVE